jgi:diketogulonate reductase-like aldo/keto reductase
MCSQIGYGTGTAWFKRAEGDENQDLIDSIKAAVEMGYMHLDGAEVYKTERELGTAIKQCKVPRDKLFVTTKVLPNIGDIDAAIASSLHKLGLDYVDLYLIHSPSFAKGDKKTLQATWAKMEEVAASGKAKSIGVSNFTQEDLDTVLETCRVRPAMNQIEFHPYAQHHGTLLQYMKNKDIKVAAYGPLVPVTKAKDGPLTPMLESLARKYGVNPGEILLRWCIEQGVVPVTTSSKPQRLSDMLRCFTFKLTPKESEDITEIGKQHAFRAFGRF